MEDSCAGQEDTLAWCKGVQSGLKASFYTLWYIFRAVSTLQNTARSRCQYMGCLRCIRSSVNLKDQVTYDSVEIYVYRTHTP